MAQKTDFISCVLEGPTCWEAAEWTFVAAIAVPVALAIIPPVRSWLVTRIVNFLSNPYTYGDYALPDHRIRGRDADIGNLGHVLRSTRRAVLTGSGGLGKSTLARYFIAKRKQNYRGVWWIDAADPAKLRAAMEALAKTLDPALAGETDSNLLVARARDAIGATRQRWLLVFDNAESPRALRNYLPEPRARLEVIVTTRWSDWPEGGHYTRMPVGVLDFSTENSPAVALLMQEAGRSADAAGARGLAEALGGLPLALVNAGAYLRDAQDIDFATYGERLEAAIRQAPPEGGDYEDSVFGAVSLSLDRLSPEAAQIADILAFWAPEGLEPALFEPVSAKDETYERYQPIPAALWPVLRAEGAVARGFAELARRSLLERRGEGAAAAYAMHRLTGEVIRARLGEEGRAEGREAAAAVLAAAYPYDADFREVWPLCAALTPHVQALAGHRAASAAAHYLYNQASIWLGEMRQDLPALLLARAALTAKKRRLDPLHREVGVGYTALGIRWKALDRPVMAEKLMARAAEISEQNPEIGDEDRAVWFSNHGSALKDLGRRALAAGRGPEAAALFRRAARRHHQALLLDRRRGDRRKIATRLNNLGTLRQAQGRRGAAIRLGRMVLRIRREVLAPDDPLLAHSLHNLAARLLQTPDWREAEPLLDQALEVREDAFAAYPRHPARIDTATFLAQAALMRGDRVKAAAIVARYAQDLDLAALQRAALIAHFYIEAEAGEAGPAVLNEILDLMGLTLEDARRLVPELAEQSQPAPEGPP